MKFNTGLLFCIVQRLLTLLLPSNAIELDSSGYSLNNFFVTFIANGKHRVRRSLPSVNNFNKTCDSKDLPQPTLDYPVVLFENLNFNNCSNNGKYIRVQADDFIHWAHNKLAPDRGKIMSWNSMIMFPGVNITFRGCCPSGNNFISIVSNWSTNSSDLNATMQHNTKLRGSDGIWYQKWLYWKMSFDLKVSAPQDTSIIKSCGTCKFNQCGITGKCECLSGYTGDNCDISPSNLTHPSEEYPLVLFPELFYGGKAKHLKAGERYVFAENVQGAFGGRKLHYKSMRVYYNRTVIFERAGSTGKSVWSPGNDIHNIEEFMESNQRVANPIWFDYSLNIVLQFQVNVE